MGRPSGDGARSRLIQALDCQTGSRALAVCRAAFERGLVIETSGTRDHVVKCIPPLTIPDDELEAGFAILDECVQMAA